MFRYLFAILLLSTSLFATAEESGLRNYICVSENDDMPKDVTIEFIVTQESTTWITYYEGRLMETTIDAPQSRTTTGKGVHTILVKDTTEPLYPKKFEAINVRTFTGWMSVEHEGQEVSVTEPIVGEMHYRLIAEDVIGRIPIRTVGERMIIAQVGNNPKREIYDEQFFMLDEQNRPVLLGIHGTNPNWQWVCEIE